MHLFRAALIVACTAATAASQDWAQYGPPDTERLFPMTVNGRAGVIDAQGRVVIEPTYEILWGFFEGLALVSVNGKFGYINPKGEIVIQPRFRYGQLFSQGLAAVETDNGWTFIDRRGQPITLEVFDQVGRFSDGVAPVRVGDVWGYINTAGVFVIVPQYRLAWSFSHGRAIVYPANDVRCQLIDNTGLVLLQLDGSDCRGDEEALAVRAGGYGTKYGYITLTGAPLTPFIFDWAEPFRDGLAAVRIDRRTGFIDAAGNMAISPRFDSDDNHFCSRGFFEGLSAVMINGRCGYIDPSGTVRIAPQFEKAAPFRNGLAWVWLDRRCGYIGKTGSVEWMPPLPDDPQKDQ